jgi:hypothetical protein
MRVMNQALTIGLDYRGGNLAGGLRPRPPAGPPPDPRQSAGGVGPAGSVCPWTIVWCTRTRWSNTYSTSWRYSRSSAACSCSLNAPNASSGGRSSASLGTVFRRKAFRWTRARCSPSLSGRRRRRATRCDVSRALPTTTAASLRATQRSLPRSSHSAAEMRVSRGPQRSRKVSTRWSCPSHLPRCYAPSTRPARPRGADDGCEERRSGGDPDAA